MKKKVSVIIPVYNIEQYLRECLDSVLSQSYSNIEVILVDDGSTDGSGKICGEFVQKDSRVKVFYQENKGVSHARNVGLKCSTGDYIAFVDGDDCVMPEYVETLVENLEQNNVDLSIVDYFIKSDEKKCSTRSKADRKVLHLTAKEALNNIYDNNLYLGYLWNKLFDRKIIDQHKLFLKEDVKIWEDLLFCCEYLEKINRVAYVRVPMYIYRVRAGSAVNNEKNKREISKLQALKYLNDLALRFSTNGNFYCFTKKQFLDMLVSLFYYEDACVERKYVVENVKGNFKKLSIKHKLLYIFIRYFPVIAKKLVRKGCRR